MECIDTVAYKELSQNLLEMLDDATDANLKLITFKTLNVRCEYIKKAIECCNITKFILNSCPYSNKKTQLLIELDKDLEMLEQEKKLYVKDYEKINAIKYTQWEIDHDIKCYNNIINVEYEHTFYTKKIKELQHIIDKAYRTHTALSGFTFKEN